MKIQGYLYIALIFLVCILTISAVSAADDSASDIISADDNELILEESISDDVSISSNENEELISENIDLDELDDSANEKQPLKDDDEEEEEIDFSQATIKVNDLHTVYGSSDRITFDLFVDDIQYDNITLAIHIRGTYSDIIYEEFKGKSGSNNGWVVGKNVKPDKYQVIVLPLNEDIYPSINPGYGELIVNRKFSLNSDPANLNVGDTYDIEYSFDPMGDEWTTELTFTSNDTSIVTVDSTGRVKALREGEATIIVNYIEKTLGLQGSTSEIYIKVGKTPTQLTAADVTTTYNINKDLVITLKDNAGNPISDAKVTVSLGEDKEYKTDKNGQIKVATGNLDPKTYTVKISYAETTSYMAASLTAKITVNKASPKITAKAKTFKYEDKTKKYTVTLKDNKGTVMKNTKVNLKVDGKTYTATTNSKGVATFKLTKLTKKGTYNTVITYAGDKYYNKTTKKVKITVKAPAWKTVAKGSKDKVTVKKIQRALKKNGYYLTYKGHYLKVDGIFEYYTERAVKQFQKAKSLKVTGKVDYATAKKLKII